MQFFNSIQDPMFLSNPQFKILQANKILCSFFEKTAEEVIGASCFEIIHKTKNPLHSCPHQNVLETKKPATSESRVRVLLGFMTLLPARVVLCGPRGGSFPSHREKRHFEALLPRKTRAEVFFLTCFSKVFYVGCSPSVPYPVGDHPTG